jgi:type VI secretion system protein VasG
MSQSAIPLAVEDCRRRIGLIDTETAILDREMAAGADHAALRTELADERAKTAERLAELEARWESERKLAADIAQTRTQIEEQIENQSATVDRDALRAQLNALTEELLYGLQGEHPLIFPVVDAQAVAAIVES